SSAPAYGDAWTWDSVGNTWKQLVPIATGGPSRDLHALGYDLVRGRVVLFGGFSNPTYFADTWELAAAAPAASAATYRGGGAGGAGGAALGAVASPTLGGRPLAGSRPRARPNPPGGVPLAELPTSIPVGGGCTLLVPDPFVAVALTTDGLGTATLPLPVPG